MTEAQAKLIRDAGLRAAHVKITGYAPECDGEPEILSGLYTAAVAPAFLFVRRETPASARATLSNFPAFASAETEMELERLNAEMDADGGVGQQAVIDMLRNREAEPVKGEVMPPIAPPVPPLDPPIDSEATELSDLSDEEAQRVLREAEDGWG